jgi:hypothetical protein
MIELIDVNPITGLQTLIEFDAHNPKKFHIHHRQDVTAIIERNKELQKHPEYKKQGIKRGMQHVATVPDIWQHHLLKHHNINVLKKSDWPRFKKILQDPAYKHLRATLGDI